MHALRAQDRDVRALVRRPERAAHLRALGVELAAGDITDPASLRAAVAGCTHVVHLVAIIQGSPDDFQRVMTQGTKDLVAAAQDAGVERFVLMSALGTSAPVRGHGPVLRREVGRGAGRRRLGARARDLPPELRLRPRRRRAAHLHEAGALLAGRHGDRRRACSARSRSGSTTSPSTSRARSTRPRPRTGPSSSAGRTPSTGTASTGRSPRCSASAGASCTFRSPSPAPAPS